jgi:hypothetical protein
MREEECPMSRAVTIAVIVGFSVIVVCGCGGGGGTQHTSGGTVRGVVRPSGADPASLRVSVDGQPLPGVVVGADGEFTIPGLSPGSHWLSVYDPGTGEGGSVEIIVDPETDTNVEITPELCGRIVGHVSKQDGEGNSSAAAGVEVVALGGPVVIALQGGTGEAVPITPGGQASAFTDSTGAYTLAALPPGFYMVSVTVPGFQPAVGWTDVTPGGEATLDFTLLPQPEPGVGTVFGTVTGQNAAGAVVPIVAARVTITVGQVWILPVPTPLAGGAAPSQLVMPPIQPPWFEVGEFSTLTDGQGQYSLNVPTGDATIMAFKEGYGTAFDSVTVTNDTKIERDLALPPLPEPWPGPVVPMGK